MKNKRISIIQQAADHDIKLIAHHTNNWVNVLQSQELSTEHILIRNNIQTMNNSLQQIYSNRKNIMLSTEIISYIDLLNETCAEIIKDSNNIFNQNEAYKHKNFGAIILQNEKWADIIHIKITLLHLAIMSSFIIENQGTTASIFEILTDLYLNTVAFAPCLNDGVVIPLYLLFHDYPETISNLIIEKLKLINDETFYKNHNIPECNIFRNRNHNLEKITQTFNFLLIPLANKMELDETQIEFLESYIKNPEDFEFYESSIKELTLILIKLFQNHELYRPHHST